MIHRVSGACAATLLVMLTGCVTYGGFPEGKIGAAPPTRSAPQQDYFFAIEQGTLAGGAQALHDALRERSPYGRGTHTDEKPAHGLYVKATIDALPPSVPAVVALYLSVSTLTFLPAWSTKDGYRVIFDVYRDGTQVGSLDYPVRRKGFVWIAMLPLAWVNLFTYSEDEVFRAVADQFFQDAKPYFGASKG